MNKNYISILFFITILLNSCSDKNEVGLFYDSDSPIIDYGSARLVEALQSKGYTIYPTDIPEIKAELAIIILASEFDVPNEFQKIVDQYVDNVKEEGYKLVQSGKKIYVIGKSAKGCLYGIMDLKEQINLNGSLSEIEERQVNPALSFRAIKYNLPWAPYRPGPATEIHKETCRDLAYWESFLDMMAENRFNVLSLWSNHLFPYMIRTKKYPLATPFNDLELAEWKSFWSSLFKMAKDRGIDSYIVNWNIVVSPEFVENYGAKLYGDRSEVVIDYTRESVSQLINEYEDLTGLGVTLADWMGNWGDDLMTPKEREDWIERTFVDGMKNANRKVRFIHRAVLAGDPAEMRRVIEHAELPQKAIVEVKFNWSHGHSTPILSITHANEQGSVMSDLWEPLPKDYFISWMIRNEDFFVLRWGSPDFIREHIRQNNQPYVDGYFVGSEGYIPALDYSHVDSPAKTWRYAFQKQWMFYYLWGQLMYNPEISDQVLANIFNQKYPDIDGNTMMKAYSLASEVPLAIASFYKGTWDFTLYSEGFMAPWQFGFDDQKSPFISIEELVRHEETLDPRMLSIKAYTSSVARDSAINDDLITPLELAAYVQEHSDEALLLVESLRGKNSDPTFHSELDDLETWCYLGLYFAFKLRAGVSVENYELTSDMVEKQKSLEYLEKCREYWNEVIRSTETRYQPMPYVSFGHHQPRWPEFTSFHWKHFLKDVEADIEYVRNLK